MGHAVFEVIRATPEYIFIQDAGHETNRTVTNDAEWVLEELALEHGLITQRVFYADSENQADEIGHDKGRFVRFNFGHEGVAL